MGPGCKNHLHKVIIFALESRFWPRFFYTVVLQTTFIADIIIALCPGTAEVRIVVFIGIERLPAQITAMTTH